MANGHVLLHSPATGLLTSFTAAADNAAARGVAFQAAHAQMTSGDILHFGPGDYAIPRGQVGIPNTTLVGGHGTRWVSEAGEAGINYRPRRNQHFIGLRSLTEGSTISLETSDIGADVDGVVIRDCEFIGAADVVAHFNGWSGGTGARWRIWNCHFRTLSASEAPFADDCLYFINGAVAIDLYSCFIHLQSSGTPSLNAFAVEAGESVTATLRNCHVLVAPTGHAGGNMGAVRASGNGRMRVLNSEIELRVPAALEPVYAAECAGPGARVEVAGSLLDVSKLNRLDGGTITSVEVSVP